MDIMKNLKYIWNEKIFHYAMRMIQKAFPNTKYGMYQRTATNGDMFRIERTNNKLQRAINTVCDELKSEMYDEILNDNGYASDDITELFLIEARVSYHFADDDDDNDSIIEADISERVD